MRDDDVEVEDLIEVFADDSDFVSNDADLDPWTTGPLDPWTPGPLVVVVLLLVPVLDDLVPLVVDPLV